MIIVPLSLRPAGEMLTKDVMRYALTCVKLRVVERVGILQATDGKRAIDIRWPHDSSKPPDWAPKATDQDKEILVPGELWSCLPAWSRKDQVGDIALFGQNESHVSMVTLSPRAVRTKRSALRVMAPYPDVDAILKDGKQWESEIALHNLSMLESSLGVVRKIMSCYHAPHRGKSIGGSLRLYDSGDAKHPGITIQAEKDDIKIRVIQMGLTEVK